MYVLAPLALEVEMHFQNVLLQGTGQEWITRDIETGHSAQLAAPEKLSSFIIEIAKQFEAM